MSGTVEYDPSVTTTSHSEIAAANLASSPKARNDSYFEISSDELDRLEQRFDSLSGNDGKKRKQELRRFIAARRSCSTELPFTWSVNKLRECFNAGDINLDDAETNIAIQRVYMFHNVDETWRHHPRYEAIAREFANPVAFFHTLGQFITAGYLFEHNNSIGFSISDVHAEAKPDLYARLRGDQKFFIEVKSPSSLVWNRYWNFEKEAINKNLNSILKKGGQINRSRPGIIVMMINHPNPSVYEFAKSRITTILKNRGRDRKYLAGVVALHSGALETTGADSNLGFSVRFEFTSLANPHCEFHPNPLINGIDRK